MNILFLAGGHRVALARHFINSGKKRGLDIKIFGYEKELQIPLASIAEIIVGREWHDPRLMAHLRNVVEENDIRVILPFNDESILATAAFIDQYNDVYSPVTAIDQVSNLTDKIVAARILEHVGLPVPSTYKTSRPNLPLIAKPRHSFPAQAYRLIDTVPQFKHIMTMRDQYLLQKFISEKDEYTVDCFVSRTGQQLCVSPRRRLEIVDGEVTSTVTVKEPEIERIAREALERLKLHGNVTVQCIRDRESGNLYIIDIHPRMANGIACTIEAGADIPGMILDEAREMLPMPAENVRVGVKIVRYLEDVIFNLDQVIE